MQRSIRVLFAVAFVLWLSVGGTHAREEAEKTLAVEHAASREAEEAQQTPERAEPLPALPPLPRRCQGRRPPPR